MGLAHRLLVIKISTILKYGDIFTYMNDCSCICVIGRCMNYIMPLDPVFICIFKKHMNICTYFVIDTNIPIGV